jgi:ribonucleotide monophosphatase NagD (HAD superfamily)
VAAVETACGREAELVGKPAPTMYEALLRAAHAEAAGTVVIGDSATDLIAASRLNAYKVLVLSGVTGVDDGRGDPDLVIDSLADLLPALEAARSDLLDTIDPAIMNPAMSTPVR